MTGSFTELVSLSIGAIIVQAQIQLSSQGVRERARVPQLVMLCRRWAHLQFNALLGAPVALMEQLQAIVLPENAHDTATSGLLKKIKVSNTRALSLTPCV